MNPQRISPESHADLSSTDELTQEVGLAGLIEKQLTRYINADRQVLPASGLYDRVLQEVERPLFRVVLNLVDGNKIKAAQILGLNRNTLLKKMRAHGLEKPKPQKRKARRVDDV
jgi:two-component system nitrogen regulation response regulator GlnG